MDNKYDKIFKENFDPLIPHLLEAVLKLQLVGQSTLAEIMKAADVERSFVVMIAKDLCVTMPK